MNWTDFKKEKPEHTGWYLVQLESMTNDIFFIDWKYRKQYLQPWYTKKVTHWMKIEPAEAK